MSAFVRWHHQLVVRQSVPILAGFAMLLISLLLLGYLYLRQNILNTARSQVLQLVGSIARQDEYSRQWVERGMGSLAALSRTFPKLSMAKQIEADRRVVSMISDLRGRQTVDVRYFDTDDVLHWRRYGSAGLLQTAKGSTAAGSWTEDQLRTYQKPQWHKPMVSAERSLTLSYCMSLRRPSATAGTPAEGILCVNMDTPWFLDRVYSLSTFEDSLPFFLTTDGYWTLPAKADAPLEDLRQRMLRTSDGEMSVRYEGKTYTAVFMHLRHAELRMGVLIPREMLFGRLDQMSSLLMTLGFVALCMVAYSLYHSSTVYLLPLEPLGRLADRLSRGELRVNPAGQEHNLQRLPRVAQRVHLATEQLRTALSQRVHDITLAAQAKERLLGELAFARTLQESLRPPPAQEHPALDMAARVHTASEVCGDMYDHFWLNAHQVCCIMGSVAERGVPAALNTGRVIPLLHELLLAGRSPGKALCSANQALAPASIMVNALVGVLDVEKGVFHWASAGQQPPFLFEARESTKHPSVLQWTGNVPLGVRVDEAYQERETRLTPEQGLLFVGQRLLFVRKPHGKSYGEDGMLRFLRTHATAHDCTTLLRDLYADLETFAGSPPPEDLTSFALRWKGSGRGCVTVPSCAPV